MDQDIIAILRGIFILYINTEIFTDEIRWLLKFASKKSCSKQICLNQCVPNLNIFCISLFGLASINIAWKYYEKPFAHRRKLTPHNVVFPHFSSHASTLYIQYLLPRTNPLLQIDW